MGDGIPNAIQKHDKIVFRDGKALKYGCDKDLIMEVAHVDSVRGRDRLYVDGAPGMVWKGDVKLAWGRASKERLAALGLTEATP